MDFLNIYTSPSQTFTKLSEKPKWLIPLIIVVIFSILLSIVAITKTNWDEQKAKVLEMLQKRNVPQERIDKVMESMNPKTGFTRGLIAVLIMTPIGILIFTLVLNLLLPVLGTGGVFKKTLAVTTNSAMVRVPGAIVKAILMFIRGSSDISTSLMLFFPKMAHQGFVYGLFSKIDFFTIWELILVSLGLKVLFNIPGKKTYYVVFGLWLLYIIITAFLSPSGLG